MPGMMDTVLNLGLNDEVVAGLAAKSGDRFAYDSYRRFLDMFGNVVSGVVNAFHDVSVHLRSIYIGASICTLNLLIIIFLFPLKVMGIPHSSFEEKLENFKHQKGVDLDTKLTASDLKELVEQYKNVYLEATGEKFPSGTK